jgi:hypothetical protein
MWGNTSDSLVNGEYFAVNGTYINEVECKAAIAPGSTTLTGVNRKTGPDINGGFNLGWNCTGYAEIVFDYIVYEGTLP